ncbi:MAG: exonuclease domain-containing protein [Clostridia bacterium]
MNFFTKELNKKFSNKFDFLKLLEVVYDEAEMSCTVVFLFPESIGEISDKDRELIFDCLRDALKINAKIILKFKKSYLDPEIIEREIVAFLKGNYLSACANLKTCDVKCQKIDGEIQTSISLMQSVYEYFEQNDVKKVLFEFLKKNFIGQFGISFINTNKKEDFAILESRSFELENEIRSSVVQKIPRYQVKNVCSIFGNEITPMPEFISNIKKEKDSVILSGAISFFNEKNYIKKREKAKGENAKESKLYSFVLKDNSANISCTYFSSVANEKKMSKLCDGTKVLLIGDVRMFNNRPSVYIRSLALCEDGDNENETSHLDALAKPSEYVKIKPLPFVSKVQANWFDKAVEYNSWIMSKNFVVYDFETTGLDSDNCQIIEIGAVKIENGKLTQTFQSLINVHQGLENIIVSITGITDEMLSAAPEAKVVLSDFCVFCGDCVMAGYNSLNFDNKFLQNAAKKFDLIFDNEQIDVLHMAKARVKSGNYKLGTIVGVLGITLNDAHRALNDAIATAEVLLALNKA